VNLTEAAVKHKSVVAVVIGLIVLFGYISISKLPLQLLPNVQRPQITIYNNWRSAAPQEIEEAIVQPQEDVLRFNPGVENIVSSTSRGQGRVVLNYQLGYDMSKAMLDVINRLNQAPPLPADAGEPFVASGGDGGLPGAASILVYAGENNPVKDMIEYQDLIDEVVEPRLSRIPGVAQVNLNGRRPKEVSIIVNPFKTAMLGVQISDIASALARARDISAGFADVGRRRYTVRFLGEQEVSQLGRLVVGWRSEQPIYLEEVASISVDYAENRGVSLRNGFPSYYISISRRNDANTVELLDALNVALDELNEGPLKEADIRIQLSFDASLHIRRALSMVQTNLALGILLAMLVLFYFLKNTRATLVITLTVPISLLVAFIGLKLFNLTLNVISLAGLAFAVGLVMDAAIIVQENIYRLRQEGMNLSSAVLEGSKQVSGALFSSTMTTIAIFVPILFMQGVEGQLFKDLAITISIAVFVSMISALTILPVITSTFSNLEVDADRFAPAWERMAGLIIRATNKPWARLTLVTGILGSSVLAVWLLTPKVDFLPRANIDGISVFFDIPAGMNVKTIENELATEVVKRLEPYYKGEKLPAIRAYNFASFNGFYTQVYVYPSDPETVPELVDKLRDEILVGLPDVKTFVNQASMINVDNGGGRSISVDIQGNDLEALLKAARKGQEVISGFWENTNVSARGGLSLDEPELRVVPNDRRINTAGIDRSTLGSTIRSYTGGLYAGEYFDGNQRMDMLIRTQDWDSPEELLSLPISTPLSGVQKIGDLVSLERSVGPTRLQRVDGRRTVTLSVTPPDDITLEEALEKLQAEATPVIKAELPINASVKYRGNADRLKQALSEISRNFLLSLLILFMIMAALFKSARDGMLVLLVMPVAVAGGLAGLKLLNLVTFQSLDMLTLIGFIILLGLVVNNAILLVDQTRRAERTGLSREEAVRAAIIVRARPIFMSSFTSIFGMLPLMLIPGVGSEIYRGLATVIVGGMVTSALLTLILMPGLLRLEIKTFLNTTNLTRHETAGQGVS
jgi:multidrug efflux pump subunit AcrB